MRNETPAESGRRWTPDAFIAFWKKPDPARVIGALTTDIVGYWPRPIGEIRGARPYTAVIEAMLRAAPDFSLEVLEIATSGDLTFIRWIATGADTSGPFRFNGCDRVRVREGHVSENYVFCDDPFFARVADELKTAALH
ncbi:MAG TPA: nuclear transport factor 2 family protein [Steroidobacteraceae bacterium]|jgi:limonene-1,2-epoxide hydrolase|nr:nuclear transport factor 2 family protein [Steroidobacteraceae bacterium]